MRKPDRPSGPGRKKNQPHAQARRLVELYRVLASGGAVRLDETPASFGVSRRTIQRDLDVLRELEAGIDNRSGWQATYIVVDVVGGDWPNVPDRILLLLDRLTAARLGPLEETFRPPADFDPQDWFAPAFGVVRDRSPATVVLRVDPNWTEYVFERKWHASERLTRRPDGGLPRDGRGRLDGGRRLRPGHG